MNKAAVAAISVATVLLAGGTSLEGTTFGLTHSANPYNLKLYYVAKQKGEALDESVKKFVDGKGKGTLTATREDENSPWSYTYDENPVAASEVENSQDESKGSNILKGWKAVAQYLADNNGSDSDVTTNAEKK